MPFYFESNINPLSGSLRISGVERKDDGLYTCSGNSTGGETIAWGHITVEFKPSFEDQPDNKFWTWEQNLVNLTCLATSIPNATSKFCYFCRIVYSRCYFCFHLVGI